MSRVSEVTNLQQQRIKEMQDRFKKEELSDEMKMQLMVLLYVLKEVLL